MVVSASSQVNLLSQIRLLSQGMPGRICMYLFSTLCVPKLNFSGYIFIRFQHLCWLFVFLDGLTEFFMFTPILGEMIQFDLRMSFQSWLFNHQLQVSKLKKNRKRFLKASFPMPVTSWNHHWSAWALLGGRFIQWGWKIQGLWWGSWVLFSLPCSKWIFTPKKRTKWTNSNAPLLRGTILKRTLLQVFQSSKHYKFQGWYCWWKKSG